jgi:hypothetical protein
MNNLNVSADLSCVCVTFGVISNQYTTQLSGQLALFVQHGSLKIPQQQHHQQQQQLSIHYL